MNPLKNLLKTTTESAQKFMRSKGIDCWLTTTSEAADLMSQYLLNTKCYSRHAIIIPAYGKPCAIVSRMEEDMVSGLRTVGYKDAKGFRLYLKKEIRKSGRKPTVALNYVTRAFSGRASMNFLTHGEYLALKNLLKTPKFVSSADMQYHLRYRKGREEIKLHEKSALIACRAMKAALESLRGSTEYEVAALAEYEMKKRGAETAFDTIVASGKYSAQPHHKVSETKKIKSGDAVLIDLGASYMLRCSDISRTVFVGKPPPGFLRAFEAVERAQAAAIEKIKPGVNGEEVDNAARNALSGYEKNIEHGCGHPLGIFVHDVGPSFSQKHRERKLLLEEGMIMTVEPGLYFKNRFGIRIEDDVLVTKTGARVMTSRI